MFIHFDSNEGAGCDNCGTAPTIMHLSTEYVDRSLNLCVGCVGMLAQVLGQASKQLRFSPEEKSGRLVGLRSSPVVSSFTLTKVRTAPESLGNPALGLKARR